MVDGGAYGPRQRLLPGHDGRLRLVGMREKLPTDERERVFRAAIYSAPADSAPSGSETRLWQGPWLPWDTSGEKLEGVLPVGKDVSRAIASAARALYRSGWEGGRAQRATCIEA